MEFTLYYRGELKSNGSPSHKQNIRRVIHEQMKDLWNHLPLSDFQHLLAHPDEYGEGSLLRRRRGFNFVSLVSESVALVAELDIRLLWPAKPGSIITSGGDLDNRLKTLLDALKMPSEATALPPGDSPRDGEDPFYCLLEDDSLVTRISIEADRLLLPVTSSAEVVLFIRVRTRQLRTLMATIGLA